MDYLLFEVSAQRGDAQTAIGTVLMWGRVFEHEHGFRAQYAKVDAVWSPANATPGQRHISLTLAAQYGARVEVVAVDEVPTPVSGHVW